MTHCGGVSAVVRQIRSIALRLVFVPALAGVLFAADATDVHVLPVQGNVFMLVSAVLLAGLGSWLLVRALAETGVLAPFPSGRSQRPI